MLKTIVKSLATRRLARLIPIARVLVIAQLALLAKRHVQLLEPADRWRFADLVRRGRALTPAEKDELRALTARLDPKAFALTAVDHLSPVPIPDRVKRRLS